MDHGLWQPLTIFLPDNLDQSVHLLGRLFGNMTPFLKGDQQLLPHVFKVFNSGIYLFAVTILAYMTWKGFILTAGSGEFLGRDNSAMVLVRAVLGVLALVPRFNGYSFIQLAVMWIVLHGVGFANQLWHYAWQHMDLSNRSPPATAQNLSKAYPTVTQLASDLTQCLVCVRNYKQKLDAKQATVRAQLDPRLNDDASTRARYNAQRQFAFKVFDLSPELSGQQLFFPGPPADLSTAPIKGGCGHFGWSVANQKLFPLSYAQSVIRQLLTGLDPFAGQIEMASDPATRTADKPTVSISALFLMQIINQYLTLVQLGMDRKQPSDTLQTTPSGGWIMAARNYYQLLKAPARGGAASALGTGIQFTNQGKALPFIESAQLKQLNAVIKEARKQLARLNPDPISKVRSDLRSTLTNAVERNSLNNAMTYTDYDHCHRSLHNPLAVMGGVFSVESKKFEDFGAVVLCDIKFMLAQIYKVWLATGLSDHTDESRYIGPLRRVRAFGLSLLGKPVAFWLQMAKDVFSLFIVKVAAYSAMAMLIMGVVSIFYGYSPVTTAVSEIFSPGATLMQMLFKVDIIASLWFVPFGMAVAVPIMLMGLMLGVYAPLLPFMLFVFGVIGWFMAVLEAMIASPLIPLGLTHPGRHEMLGSAEQAIMLLLGVFLRPVCMILGFVIAIVLLSIGIDFLDRIFFPLIGTQLSYFRDFYSGASNHGMKQAVALGGLLWFYVIALLTVISHLLSFIYQVPNRVLAVIGLPPDMPAEAQVIDQMEQEMQQTAEPMMRGGADTVQGLSRGAQRSGIGFADYIIRARKNPPKGGPSTTGTGDDGLDDNGVDDQNDDGGGNDDVKIEVDEQGNELPQQNVNRQNDAYDINEDDERKPVVPDRKGGDDDT